MIGVGGAYIYGKQKIEAPGPLQEEKVVNIPARAGMTDIADTLQREGVIDNNRWAFIGAVFALKARSELKPGEYLFQKNASLRDVIGTIVEGKVVQHAVTIPEGLTSEQIVARLPDNDIFAGSVREMPREGTMLPETYKFPRGTTPRAGDCAHAAGAEARARGNLGAAQVRTFRSRARSNWSRWPRSSRRKPASPTNAAGSLRCSSIGCGKE